MTLEIVGSSPAMPRPGEPCSSYLVRTNESAVLLDLGSGAFAKLEFAIEYANLDAVLISHMHADHFFDLVPFRYALKYGHLPFVHRIPLWLPPGGHAALDALRKAVSSETPERFFESVFAVSEYAPGEALSFGDLRVQFRPAKHFIQAYAMRLECDGSSLTYSADTAPCDEIVEFAHMSSLFLCEATLGLGTEAGKRGHSSAFEAGQMAARAAVKRLVLTHYSFADSIDEIIREAQREYRGPVEVASSGLKLTV